MEKAEKRLFRPPKIVPLLRPLSAVTPSEISTVYLAPDLRSGALGSLVRSSDAFSSAENVLSKNFDLGSAYIYA